MTSELDARLDQAKAIDPSVIDGLRTALAARAEQDIDVAYQVIDSPVGDLLLAATHAGLVRVAFGVEGHDTVLGELAARVSPRILRAPARLTAAARQLEDYFAGRRHDFDVSLDRRLSGNGFRAQVQLLLPLVPYGTTNTYAALAGRAGRPAAVRAVGSACATNPLPIVVPCHRVVRSDGSIGNYLGGPAAKAWLVDFERDHLPPP